MKRIMENNSEIVLAITFMVAFAVLAIALCLICDHVNVEEFNATRWVVNPANPASPLHYTLFH